MSELHSKF